MINNYITAPTEELVWRYEPAPKAKCLLLTKGRIAVLGPPVGKWMHEYIAWCPLPKRNKTIETQLQNHYSELEKEVIPPSTKP